jgi:hypothetical protein
LSRFEDPADRLNLGIIGCVPMSILGRRPDNQARVPVFDSRHFLCRGGGEEQSPALSVPTEAGLTHVRPAPRRSCTGSFGYHRPTNRDVVSYDCRQTSLGGPFETERLPPLSFCAGRGFSLPGYGMGMQSIGIARDHAAAKRALTLMICRARTQDALVQLR